MDNIASEIPPRGNFSFINCEFTREMLQSAFDAVESVQGGWEALLPEPVNGFMFSPRPPGSVLRQIDIAISERFDGHLGSSYGCTMRNMQGIARLGWDDYVRFYLNRSEQSVQQAKSVNQVYSTNSNAYINYLTTGQGPMYYTFKTNQERSDMNSAVALVNKLYPFRDMAQAVGWIVPFPLS